eukprot:140950-Prorocentrum_minimum.AAC.1
MACMSGDGRIDERAKPIVHPVDHVKEAPARMYDLFTCTGVQEVQGKTERECRELVVLWTHRMIEQDLAPFEVRAVVKIKPTKGRRQENVAGSTRPDSSPMATTSSTAR